MRRDSGKENTGEEGLPGRTAASGSQQHSGACSSLSSRAGTGAKLAVRPSLTGA